VALQATSFAAFHGPDPDILPWVWSLEASALTLLVVVTRARWAFAAMLLSALSVAASAWMFLGYVPQRVLAVSPVHVGNVAFIAFFVGMRRRLVALAAREDAARRHMEREAQAAAESRRQHTVRRIVHDEVLSVLIAAGYFRGPAPDVLRVEAARALQVLAGATAHVLEDDSRPNDLEANMVVRTLAARARDVAPNVRITTAVQDHCRLPPHVVEHTAQALAEAIRNATRHGQSARIQVDIRVAAEGAESQLAVRVSDNGQGFDPGLVAEGRLGLWGSLRGVRCDAPARPADHQRASRRRSGA
jgi:signal transduction histidine kinase